MGERRIGRAGNPARQPVQDKTDAQATCQQQQRHHARQHRLWQVASAARRQKARQCDQQKGRHGQWQHPRLRQPRQPQLHDVEIDGVLAFQAGMVGMGQAVRQRQHIVALALQAAGVQVFPPIQRGVILRGIANKGEIVAGDSRRQHRGQVCVIGQIFVDLAIER